MICSCPSRFREIWFGSWHVLVENFFGDRNQPRMRYPRPVMPGLDFAQLVLPHLLQRLLVRRRIILDRNLRRHASHGVNAAAVAGLDQQFDVGIQEVPLHRDQRAVGQHEVRTRSGIS